MLNEDNKPDKKNNHDERIIYLCNESSGEFSAWRFECGQLVSHLVRDEKKILQSLKRELRKGISEKNNYFLQIKSMCGCAPLPEILIEDFCEQIVELLHSIELSKKGQHVKEFDAVKFPLLYQYLSNIYVRRFPLEGSLRWHDSSLQSGRVLDSNDTIINLINSKKQKAYGYKCEKAQEHWLLIYAGGQGLADLAINIEDLEKVEINPTPFAKIFIWDRFNENIYSISSHISKVLQRGVLHKTIANL